MSENLQYKLHLEDGRKIKTVEEAKEYFLNREEEIKRLMHYQEVENKVETAKSSGSAGYGIELI